MKIVTVETLQGVNYEELGIVSGSTIQSKNMFSDFGQGLKSIVGGELKSYTGMMEKARDKATQRMIDNAVRMDADAIIGVRYTTNSIMAQAAEVLVFGTAIRYKKY
ncbi:MAG: YbjQ family protein [Bacteroidales bacterium]|nr:YbjQ family protein [Bacteroidales bacterium]